MTRYDPLYQWTAIVTTHLPTLSKPQVTVLALWSFGMVLARSCGLTSVVSILARLLEIKENTLRQRLREWCYDSDDKRGRHRTALDVSTCFAPLVGWVLSLWRGDHLALALDATTLGDRFVVLDISVLYRSCAIPVAWVIVPAATKGAWRPHWLRLLRLVWRAVPRTMTVIVLADRGLYARWLFRRIVRLGWHPLLRVNAGGQFRPDGVGQTFRPLSSFVPQPGTHWSGAGIAFKQRESRLACTLLALWAEGTDEPWLLLTDLPPEVADAAWYGLRIWIEPGFKTIKRGGWQWQYTRMTDPKRAERLWLAVAVATLWLLSVGADEGESVAADPFQALATTMSVVNPVPGKQRQATQLRLVSVFRRGWCRILVALLRQAALPSCRFMPEPWPSSVVAAPGATPCTS
jgi:hypothetical protein